MGPILALIQVEVMDAEKFREYVKGHLPTIELYGGKVILKSAGMEVIEGAWMPELFVIHEWPGVAAFKRWYVSEEYKPWKSKRKEACNLSITLAKMR